MNTHWSLLTVAVAVVSVALSGCALVAPSEVDEQLDRQYIQAQQALEQAREWNASEQNPEVYRRADRLMRKTRAEQQERPAEALIPRYQQAQLLAQQVTIESLIHQLSQTGSGSEDTTSRALEPWDRDTVVLSKTRLRALQSRIDHLETRLEEMGKQNDQLEQQIERRISANRRKQDRLEEKERTIARLRSRLEQATAPHKRAASGVSEASVTSDTGKLERDLRGTGSAITVERVPLGLRVRIAQRVLFATGEVSLKPEARRTLSTIAEHLKRHPDREVRVQGHTDDVPIHTSRYPSNWELSSHRSVNVVKHLVEAEGLREERIGAVAFGSHRPLVPNTSAENRAKNRRVEILLLSPSLSGVSEQPGD